MTTEKKESLIQKKSGGESTAFLHIKRLNNLYPQKVIIYTDGACSGNPGVGGWGAILIWGEKTLEICGGEKLTTNNKMELQAVISALNSLKRSSEVVIFTDSQYVKNGITIWIHTWLKNNFNKGKVKNQALWQELYKKSLEHKIDWQWVRGHNGDYFNEVADNLARQGVSEVI